MTDGYAHTGTASDGDVIDYQLISTLPSITSESTYLTCYTFVDTLSKGLSYNKNDVVLEFSRILPAPRAWLVGRRPTANLPFPTIPPLKTNPL